MVINERNIAVLLKELWQNTFFCYVFSSISAKKICLESCKVQDFDLRLFLCSQVRPFIAHGGLEITEIQKKMPGIDTHIF